MSSANPGLAYEDTPPLSAPLRFFLTAPVFGLIAGLVVIFDGELLGSRWTPGALAVVHLIAAGFMIAAGGGAVAARALGAQKHEEALRAFSTALTTNVMLGLTLGLLAWFGLDWVFELLGITPEQRPDHASYIGQWLKVLKSDKRAIFTAASKAQEITDWMHAQQVGDRQHEVRGAA